MRWAIDGDLVSAPVTVDGTHTRADLAGVWATGEPVTWSQVDLWRIKYGKTAEVWQSCATPDILQQIGYTFVPPAQCVKPKYGFQVRDGVVQKGAFPWERQWYEQ